MRTLTRSRPTPGRFRQVYLSPDRRGAAVDADAWRCWRGLGCRTVGRDRRVGDALMLPGDVSRSTRTDVARSRDDFADAS